MSFFYFTDWHLSPWIWVFLLSHNFFVFLHITKRVNKGSKWAWWNNNSKEKKVSWHENIQLKALLKINGNQNTKEKLAISADGYYECYAAVAFYLSLLLLFPTLIFFISSTISLTSRRKKSSAIADEIFFIMKKTKSTKWRCFFLNHSF